MVRITEDTIEQTALEWLEHLGYEIAYGPDISPGGDTLTPALSQWVMMSLLRWAFFLFFKWNLI